MECIIGMYKKLALPIPSRRPFCQIECLCQKLFEAHGENSQKKMISLYNLSRFPFWTEFVEKNNNFMV